MTELEAQRQRCADYFSGLEKALEVLRDASALGEDPYMFLFNYAKRIKREYEASKAKEDCGPIIVGNIFVNITNPLKI